MKLTIPLRLKISFCRLERMYETLERIFVVMEKLKGDMLEMILQSSKVSLVGLIDKVVVGNVRRTPRESDI